MKKEPLFVAFSTQKGGVGKTTFTVLAASYLHYLKGYNVAVVDCDFPQHSIQMMRKRDLLQIESDEAYRLMAYEQFSKLEKKAYPILSASPDEAIDVSNNFIDNERMEYDILFFDLPGTVNSKGVLKTLCCMDYIFTPISSDRLVLESGLSFALTLNELKIVHPELNLKSIQLFWNMVDGREKTDLYRIYEQTMNELGLSLLKTSIPDTKRYRKEMSGDGKAIFRSTMFPTNKKMAYGSNIETLLDEIVTIIKL